MPQRNSFIHIIPRKIAKELGLKRYFTGAPCKYGHIESRGVANYKCRECARSRDRRDVKNMLPFVITYTKLQIQMISKKDAIENNIKYYFNLNPCKHGHIGPKQTTGEVCIQCKKDKTREYREANRETLRKKGREYVSEHKEELKKYRKDNAEAIYAKAKLRVAKTRDTVNKSALRYYYKNKNKHFALCAKRRARLKQALPQWVELELISSMFQEKNEGFEVDHIVPLQSNFVCGLHCADNLQLLTRHENRKKSNRYWPDMSDTKDHELLKLVRDFKNEL